MGLPVKHATRFCSERPATYALNNIKTSGRNSSTIVAMMAPEVLYSPAMPDNTGAKQSRLNNPAIHHRLPRFPRVLPLFLAPVLACLLSFAFFLPESFNR